MERQGLSGHRNRIILWLAMIFTGAYSVWRVFFTIPWELRLIDIAFALLLLAAELVGFWEAANYMSGSLKGMEPPRPVIPPEEYPEVDVFIATYNESGELLTKTVNGCLHMEYPDKDKVHIYLCDDRARPEIQALAEHMGIGYLKRNDRRGAKAGNLNHALAHTSSPYVATFDADMIPMHDFLTELIPYFFLETYARNEDGKWERREEPDPELKIGFVQCPQSFYNCDLFQYNLFSENDVPNEQEYFFKTIQLARNVDNAVIYAGSNTILSREALTAAGGFYERAITEDLATGIMIQSMGYRCFCVGSVHANGLAPTDLRSLFRQRERWARGCIQTCRRIGILRRRGLDRAQKRDYMTSLVYWYTPVRRLMFLLAPILFSVFHIMLVDCSVGEMMLIWLPHYVFYNMALSRLSGRIRTARLSNIYDTILFPRLIMGVVLESLGLEEKQFSVTHKGRREEGLSDRIRLALPHLLLIVFSCAGIFSCLRFSFANGFRHYAVILFWLGANIYSLVMAAFFCLGRPVFRRHERFQASVPLRISFDGDRGSRWVRTHDISEGGAAFYLGRPVYLPDDRNLELLLQNEDGRYKSHLTGQVVYVQETEHGWKYSVQYEAEDERERMQLLQIVYDRIPALPVQVNPRSSFYGDLRRVARKRGRLPNLPKRRLARILLMKEVYSPEIQGMACITDFNFAYMFLTNLPDRRPENITLEADEEKHIFIKGRLVQGRGDLEKNGALYAVENLQELMGKTEFPELLGIWQMEMDRKHTDLCDRRGKTNKDGDDEFDEMKYFRGEYQ